jgi:hypothetical protein
MYISHLYQVRTDSNLIQQITGQTTNEREISQYQWG